MGRMGGMGRMGVMGRTGVLCYPMVIVSHHHEHIARREFFLPAKHHIPYTIIKYIGAFVASCNHHRLVLSHLAVAAGKTLYEFIARHHNDIGKALETDSWQLRCLVVGNHLADYVGIIKNSGVGTKMGQIVGWVYDPDNPEYDNYVDFGIKETETADGPVISLDFNVQGNILDLM